jgi:hypothetical protein
VKGETIRHRSSQKTFFLIFYKQSASNVFSIENFTSVLQLLHEVLKKFSVNEASIYDEVNSIDQTDVPRLEALLRAELPSIRLSWLQIGKIPDDPMDVVARYHNSPLTGHPGTHAVHYTVKGFRLVPIFAHDTKITPL